MAHFVWAPILRISCNSNLEISQRHDVGFQLLFLASHTHVTCYKTCAIPLNCRGLSPLTASTQVILKRVGDSFPPLVSRHFGGKHADWLQV